MKYDVFISYRRATGKDYARIIKPELEKRHLKVFLDLDELKDGKFDKRILDAIEDTPLFMIILSPGVLDRCINPDDWVRQEILHAQKCGKHIIPVEVDKSFRSIPDQVPADIKGIVGQHQFSQVDTETLLKLSMDELVQVRIRPYLVGSNITVVSSGAEIHVETDCTCEVFRFTEKLGIAQKGKDTVFRLHKGTQKLVFRSLKFENARVEKILKIPDEVYTDIVKVELASIECRIENEIEEKRWREQERIKAERARQRELEMEAKVKKQAEEERRRRASQSSTVQPSSIKVTVKPALWPRWLAWTVATLFSGVCGFLSFTLVIGEPVAIIQTGKWWTFVLASIPLAMTGQVAWHTGCRHDFYHSNRTIEYCNDDFYMSSYDVFKYNDGTREVRLNIWIVLICLVFAIVAVAIVSVGCYFLFGLFENEIVRGFVWIVMMFLLCVLGFEIMPLINAIYSWF